MLLCRWIPFTGDTGRRAREWHWHACGRGRIGGASGAAPASADLLTRLAGLVKAARDADGRFQSNRAAAERAVSAAGSTGTDSWSTASVALARLESSRSSAMSALAELDLLYAEARNAAPVEESPSATAIGDARSQVAALLEAQDSLIARLAGRLRT
ncbi:hypothetical protein ACFSHP_05180 [Novosphingobium panipatense]